MDQPDGDADSRAMEEGRGKELEHADSSEVEQQATTTAASTSWGDGIPGTELTLKFSSTEALCKRARDESTVFSTILNSPG